MGGLHWDTLASGGACTDTLEVVRTVTDAVGLSSSVVQMVALSDVQAPVVPDWPEDVETPCDVPFSDSLPLATDFNEFIWTEALDTLTGPCPAEFIVRRTLQASDVCGNETNPWFQFIFHVDTVAPIIVTPPEDLLVGDPSDVPPCAFDALVWEDACSENLVLCHRHHEVAMGSFLCTGRTVEDACDNLASGSSTSWWRTWKRLL